MDYCLKAIIQESIENMSHGADSSAPYEFEKVGRIMAEVAFGINAFRTSGGSAGGDGGEDGWFYDRRGCRYKIACSICNKTNLNGKIRKEMAANQNGYVFFCTNQEISGKKRQKYWEIYPNIVFADINDIVSATERDYRLKEILGIPVYESLFYLDELRTRHQFIGSENRIAGYIERKVIVKGDDNKEMVVPFIEWAKDKKARLKLLEAPAGYGKTCLMEQLYMNVLNDDSLLLPPIYYDLKNFDGIDKLIDRIVGRRDGFEKYNFFFLFDGLDEIPYDVARQLIQQIDDLLTASTNHNAIVILSVRKNEYQKDLFDGRMKLEIAQVKALDAEDIKEIIAKRGFSDEEASTVLSKLESSNSFDNVFYVSSMLDYYAETKDIPVSRIDLFEYLLKKDKDMLSRKHRIDEQKFNSAVLYVSLTRKPLPDGIEIYKGLPISSLDFSHRNIQEYAAAKALSTLSCEEIIFLISSEGIIVPHAKNMFGFLLNILAETEFSEVKRLMEYFDRNKLNLDVLLMIEPGRLLPYLRRQILHEALTYYVDNTYYDIPNSLADFICDIPESGYEELLSFIKDCDDSHIAKALMITYQIVVHRPSVCPKVVADYLYEMFLREIAENIKKTAVLDNLAYILRHIDGKLPDLKSSAVERILSIAENSIYDPEFVMSLFAVLKTGSSHLTESDMDRVADCFFAISKENHMCAYSAPFQIKAGYKIPSSSIIYCTDPFYDLVYSYILANRSFFFSLLRKYKVFLKDNERMIDGYDPFSGLIARAAADLFASNGFSEEEIKELIAVILLEYRFGYHLDSKSICTELFKTNESGLQLLCNILIVFSKSESNHKQRNGFAFEPIINRLFADEKFFGVFRDLAGGSFDEAIRFFFRYNLSGALPIPVAIKEYFPLEILKEIVEQKERNEKAETEEKKHKKHIEESFHIVFNDEEFRKEARSIFDEMESSGRGIYELSHTPDYHSYSYVNEFLIATIGASRCSDYEDFISSWFDESHDLKVLLYLMRYLESYNLSYSLLSEEEKHWIYGLAVKIYNMPFRKEYLGFQLMSILMRQCELMERMRELIQAASFPIENFIDIGMSAKINKYTIADPYEFYSIDYLENYMNPLYIAGYLIDHFRMMLIETPSRFVAIGYMTKHKSSLLQYEMKSVLKPILIGFINDNLSEKGLFGGYEFLSAFGISLCDFDICRLSEHILIEDETNPDFVFCTAYEILSYFSSHGSDYDKELAAACYNLLFEKNENILYKKRAAEAYISVKSDNYKMNHWYAEYCLSPEGMISTHCDNERFIFSSIDSLPDIERMIISAVSGSDEKSSILFRLAVNSYKAILGNLVSTEAEAKSLNPILSSLKNVRNQTSNFRVIKLLNDMETSIAINLYSEPDWSLLQWLLR